MKKIKIERNTNGDTRVATKVPSIREFEDSNYKHTQDVKDMMNAFADEIKNKARSHDWSKLIEPHKSAFYRDLCNTIEGRMDFESGEWCKFHYSNERHHLLKRCPDNVNLVDVIEMICDCVCAGMARSGEVRDLEISSDILAAAVKNTVELCKGAVELEESDEN